MRARVNPYDETGGALYQQLATVLRDAIASGDLGPHEALPAEADLAEASGLHRNTVRHALSTLVAEGLLVKRTGRPARVAAQRQVRRMTTSRYAEALEKIRANGGVHPDSSAFTEDHGVDWSAYGVGTAYEEVLASPKEANRLELGPTTGTSWWVLRRQLVKRVHGVTVQLQTSVIPLPLVENTPVADPKRQPWPGGTIAELYSIGQEVTRVREEARWRAPTPLERRALGIETTSGVLEVERVFYAGQRAVEFSVTVVEAASYSLLYETEL